MAANPVLKDSTFEKEIAASRGQWGAPQSGDFAGGRGQQGTGAPTGSPGVMTVKGTVGATTVLVGLVSIAGVFGYTSVVAPTVEVINGREVVGDLTIPVWMIGTFIAGIVFSLISSFKPKMARFTGPLYALSFGTVVGGISKLYDYQTNGVVLQAVAATLTVSAAMLFLYGTRILKVTNRMRTVVTAATMGIFMLYVGAFILQIAGVNVRFWREPSLLGIGLSVLIVGIAAFNLALDFDFIERASAAGSPKYMEWYGAFGVTVTLVWLYLEILRLISMLNRR